MANFNRIKVTVAFDCVISTHDVDGKPIRAEMKLDELAGGMGLCLAYHLKNRAAIARPVVTLEEVPHG